MDSENVFRSILVFGFLLMGSIGLYHRIQSQSTGEKLNRREEGIFVLISLRLLGLLGLIGLITYMINPAWMGWSSIPLPTWLRWAGVGLGVVFVLLTTWVFRSIGKNITDTVVTRADHTLVTSGPYRWVRHPFYVAFALGIVSVSIQTASWYFALTGGLAFVLIVVRTRTEEEKLIERFGEKYQEYMKRTGKFVPRLKF